MGSKSVATPRVTFQPYKKRVKGELREKNDLFPNDLPTFVVSIFDY